MEKEKASVSDFVLDIEKNAFSSLTHGIEHFIESDTTDNLKFAIIHVFHAVELFLKARLAKEHPLLIFTKPECEIDEDSHTVRFDVLLGRLRNVGVNLGDFVPDLAALRRVRNSIEHHRITATKKDVRSYIGRASKFLNGFLERELGMTLQDELEDDKYKVLYEAIYSYEERLKSALGAIEKLMSADEENRLKCKIVSCSECKEQTIVIPDSTYSGKRTRCNFCMEEFYYTKCSECSKTILSNRDFDETIMRGICRQCWDDIRLRDRDYEKSY